MVDEALLSFLIIIVINLSDGRLSQPPRPGHRNHRLHQETHAHPRRLVPTTLRTRFTHTQRVTPLPTTLRSHPPPPLPPRTANPQTRKICKEICLALSPGRHLHTQDRGLGKDADQSRGQLLQHAAADYYQSGKGSTKRGRLSLQVHGQRLDDGTSGGDHAGSSADGGAENA